MSAGCYHKGIANDNKNGVRNDEYLFKTDSDSLLCLPGTGCPVYPALYYPAVP